LIRLCCFGKWGIRTIKARFYSRQSTNSIGSLALWERALPGLFDGVVLLRKVGNKNKKGKVLHKTINELDRFPLPLGEG
jgi:hypothetical protein